MPGLVEFEGSPEEIGEQLRVAQKALATVRLVMYGISTRVGADGLRLEDVGTLDRITDGVASISVLAGLVLREAEEAAEKFGAQQVSVEIDHQQEEELFGHFKGFMSKKRWAAI